jgi:hypothetical protein
MYIAVVVCNNGMRDNGEILSLSKSDSVIMIGLMKGHADVTLCRIVSDPSIAICVSQ